MKVSVVRPSSVRRPSVRPSVRLSTYRMGEQIIVFFCSGRIRTLVAMATYSFYILIMGKRGNRQFFSVSLEIFGFFLQKCLLRCLLLFIRLLTISMNLIGCRGGKKGQFS